jgi:large subunit ribosomal protein L6
MSRIGKAPIELPSGVEIELSEGIVCVKGPKGQLEQAVVPHTGVQVSDGRAEVSRESDEKVARSMHGLMRALLNNMVVGVSEGFQRELEIQGVGWRAQASGKTLTLNVGYSHPVEMGIPDGLEVTLDGQTKIVVKGIDKQRVGQFAAEIREVRPPEPYKGKGIRYVDEYVRRKVGKAGVGSGA